MACRSFPCSVLARWNDVLPAGLAGLKRYARFRYRRYQEYGVRPLSPVNPDPATRSSAPGRRMSFHTYHRSQLPTSHRESAPDAGETRSVPQRHLVIPHQHRRKFRRLTQHLQRPHSRSARPSYRESPSPAVARTLPASLSSSSGAILPRRSFPARPAAQSPDGPFHTDI